MFFIAYALKGQVHVFAKTSENCKSLVPQDKCNIEIFLSSVFSWNIKEISKCSLVKQTCYPEQQEKCQRVVTRTITTLQIIFQFYFSVKSMLCQKSISESSSSHLFFFLVTLIRPNKKYVCFAFQNSRCIKLYIFPKTWKKKIGFTSKFR